MSLVEHNRLQATCQCFSMLNGVDSSYTHLMGGRVSRFGIKSSKTVWRKLQVCRDKLANVILHWIRPLFLLRQNENQQVTSFTYD